MPLSDKATLIFEPSAEFQLGTKSQNFFSEKPHFERLGRQITFCGDVGINRLSRETNEIALWLKLGTSAS